MTWVYAESGPWVKPSEYLTEDRILVDLPRTPWQQVIDRLMNAVRPLYGPASPARFEDVRENVFEMERRISGAFEGATLYQALGNGGAPQPTWVLAIALFPNGTLPRFIKGFVLPPTLREPYLAWLSLYPKPAQAGRLIVNFPKIGNYMSGIRSLGRTTPYAKILSRAESPREFLIMLREVEDECCQD